MPIDIEDYAMAQNYYYVDKTDLIKDIIDSYIIFLWIINPKHALSYNAIFAIWCDFNFAKN